METGFLFLTLLCTVHLKIQRCVEAGFIMILLYACNETRWGTARALPKLPYILESNPHPFYSFGGLKNQTWVRIACGLDSRSWAGFWKNDTAAMSAVRTVQYNNLFYLLFILYNILYNIYNLLFIRLAVITHTWIAISHPVTVSCGAFVPLTVKWPHTAR